MSKQGRLICPLSTPLALTILQAPGRARLFAVSYPGRRIPGQRQLAARLRRIPAVNLQGSPSL